MKVTIKETRSAEAKILSVKAGVRYWEDAMVDGIEDSKGNLIPCRDGDLWCPEIDIDKGKILNWEEGKKAEIHYKVCDAGSYFVKDADGNILLEIENDYVPKIMCPEENGYGDYIIMNVGEDGQIKNWVADIGDDFEKD